MQEWKARQQAFHHMNTDYSDDLNNVDIVWRPNNVVEDAIRHFEEYVDEWIYPAKSFVVAICYAKWLSEDYGEDFYELLRDKDLLAGNDPYFVKYNDSPLVYDTYNKILNRLGYFDNYWSRDSSEMGMVPDIRKYYEEEMMYGI
jgi:hypothetical protein